MMEARGLGRMKEGELEARRKTSSEEMPDGYYDSQTPPPEYVTDAFKGQTGSEDTAAPVAVENVQGEISQDEIADPMQINLMAHALSLNELLCDKNMVDKEDIVRAGDFSCVNLKKMIKEYYDIYTVGQGVSIARFIDVMSRYVLNGRPAEDVILEAMTNCDKYTDSRVLRDMYLAILYKVRLESIRSREEALVRQLSVTEGEERDKIMSDLKKIDLYKKKIKDKESKL